MSGKKIIEGLEEALAVAKGEAEPYRVHQRPDPQTAPPCATDAAAQSARREALEAAAEVAKSDADEYQRRIDESNQAALACEALFNDEEWRNQSAYLHAKESACRNIYGLIRSLASSIEAGGGGSDVSGEQTAVPCASSVVAQSRFCDHQPDGIGIECRRCGSWTRGSEPPACPPYITRVEPDGSRLPHIKTVEENQRAWITWGNEELYEHPGPAASIEPHTLAAHGGATCEPGTVKPCPNCGGPNTAHMCPPPPQDGVTELPSEETIARAFYLGMYEREGGKWEANETKDIWLRGARGARAILTAIRAGEK